jgi:flavin reductase (DIM6/NTAB) family NADH-FMN oxidoreductase RutF
LFRAVLGRFATGVSIVTARDPAGRDHGMTVNAFSSLSLEPPMILVCIGNDATMAPVMQTATTFTVNILNDGQESLSRRFAGEVDDRFADIESGRSGLDNVMLRNSLGGVDCRVVARHPAGDHVIVVGLVESAWAQEGRPLLYYRGGYAELER